MGWTRDTAFLIVPYGSGDGCAASVDPIRAGILVGCVTQGDNFGNEEANRVRQRPPLCFVILLRGADTVFDVTSTRGMILRPAMAREGSVPAVHAYGLW